jgi:alkylhydroperoxidase family enzyme
VSGAPELVGSFVEKYKDLKARCEEAETKADKFERLYLELKVRADELAELEASLPTVQRLEAELEHEGALRRKVTEELEQLKREQEELLAMQ